MPPTDEPKATALLAYPGFQILDLAGPHEVFAGANTWADREVYRLSIMSAGGGPVDSESGLIVTTTQLDDHPIDTLIVSGGDGVQDARHDRRLVEWVGAAAECSRRVASVCSGAFLLGEAGLLDDRRVTTHWARAEQLAAAFPTATVDPDPIFLCDGVWTSAGVTAGIDLALALVADDLGAECAQSIARHLVMFLRRPGGQSQFAAPVWTGAPERDGIRAAVEAIHRDPGAVHSVAALADAAAMSPRHFSRVFTREIRCTPGRYVERVRVEAARNRLESTTDTADTIARQCGFGTAETMRRAFLRCVGVPPQDYRHRFGRPTGPIPSPHRHQHQGTNT